MRARRCLPPVEGITLETLEDFARSHPASWIGPLCERVDEAAPEGYFSRLASLAEALLCLVAA